ncbi:GFA family protein [Microvirga rosea]
MSTRTAHCSCDRLQIHVHGAPRGVGICRCLACQRRTGNAFAPSAVFAGSYEITGQATECVRSGDKGAQFRERFYPGVGRRSFTPSNAAEYSGDCLGTTP